MHGKEDQDECAELVCSENSGRSFLVEKEKQEPAMAVIKGGTSHFPGGLQVTITELSVSMEQMIPLTMQHKIKKDQTVISACPSWGEIQHLCVSCPCFQALDLPLPMTQLNVQL